MTPDIILVFAILAAAVVLLVSEWIPMEVTALLVLGTVAVTGLVPPADALAGFGSPAVVTVWAVFILSGGLTRTGVANLIGKLVLRMAGTREAVMVVVIMTTAGVLSAVMNNVAVAALMLPVVMDVARATATPAGRLLLPLAYGSLLGGLTTQIGTPPNILVTEALREAGMTPFAFFDFTPLGVCIMISGTLFMVAAGRHLLPRRDPGNRPSREGAEDWRKYYALHERLFHIRIPPDSPLVGKSLNQSRIGSALGLNVIAITRNERTLVAPDAGQRLEAGDQLTAEGALEEMETLQHWRLLAIPADTVDIGRIYLEGIRTAEVRIPAGSPLVGSTLNRIGFRRRYAANVLALKHADSIRRTGLQDIALAAGDHLLLAGRTADIDALRDSPDMTAWRIVDRREIVSGYLIQERLQLMQVPADSALVGKDLKQARLGAALGGRILGILRESEAIVLPEPGETLRSNDRLVVEGHPVDFDIMRGLERLRIDPSDPPAIESLVTRRYGLMEVILSPHARLSGKTLRQLGFREKFGLNVLAIWRDGRARYTALRDTALKFGDALLLFGDTRRLHLLGREPDFIVLTASAAEPVNTDRAPVSLAVMAAVLLPVLMGWVPIYIAAVIGAAVMVLSGCLNMEEAYRQIEWKAVFLIAGMLPLGQALDRTGAARLIAEQVATLLGPFGPQAVMAGFVALTFLATCFIPTAALVVLMAPIVLKASADLNVAPHAMMMAVAMAASASFITPIAHPANIMVMGPGGYRFADYLKVGGLLTVVVFAVIVGVLPLLWPLRPTP